ncbi:MAG: ribosome biogenesis GTPase YlqF [Bacillota bacterium]|nr:ribosome biogenesis GTPase YlqF [Bacillota bacterium]
MNIQWYPGHMAKTKRMIVDQLKLVDLVCEIVDARIPVSSRNPDIDSIAASKPRLIVLNRADQSDPELNKKWASYFRLRGFAVILTDSKKGVGIGTFLPAVKLLMKDKIKRNEEKGQAGRAIKIMVVGVPNVGKSSFINRIIKRKSAKAEDKPGVTRGKQWFSLGDGLELLDTPGILWPKFDDEKTGMHLAFTGAVRDEIMDLETLASNLMAELAVYAPHALISRYKVDAAAEKDGYTLLKAAAKKRGFLLPGGKEDTERMARILLDEFRGGLLGKITLEVPHDAG